MLLAIITAVAETGAAVARRAVSSARQAAERQLVEALRHGDQRAYSHLVRKHWGSMVRVARGVLRDETVAAEVVQETWETVFKELPRFRGESSLSTWIYRILINRAKRVGRKESRTIPFSALLREAEQEEHQDPMDEFTWYGRWRSPVHGWKLLDQEGEAMNKQGIALLAKELERLPEAQRVVVTMRDVEGLESIEVCELLGISEGNQRVLLHRGRTQLRHALEAAEGELPGSDAKRGSRS